ncbi:potassium channel family protein [Cnuibacter sp. UC19_7]|uniref:potassium channel family protein n=1 Tax=Cnuibacter sp. UC19_7 TaxID=3350166 RepID=UPI0036708890
MFLLAYAGEILADLQGPAADITENVILVTWTAFIIDYVVRLVLAKGRWRWFRHHLFDLAIIVLPMLRPLRLLRLVTLVAILNRTAGTAFRGRVAIYVAGGSALLVFVAALAVFDAERDVPDASITSFGDALWWAFVTITTVGYGDYSPVTFEGRVIAVFLMLGGIALLGTVTATLASWIVERVSTRKEHELAATRGQVAQLSEDLADIKRLLQEGLTPPST